MLKPILIVQKKETPFDFDPIIMIDDADDIMSVTLTDDGLDVYQLDLDSVGGVGDLISFDMAGQPDLDIYLLTHHQYSSVFDHEGRSLNTDALLDIDTQAVATEKGHSISLQGFEKGTYYVLVNGTRVTDKMVYDLSVVAPLREKNTEIGFCQRDTDCLNGNAQCFIDPRSSVDIGVCHVKPVSREIIVLPLALADLTETDSADFFGLSPSDEPFDSDGLWDWMG